MLNLDFLPYGGDYNPEQWPPDVWQCDDAAFDAARINTCTIGVFAWALLQPDEQTFDFSSLDATFDRLTAAGRRVVLATPTGAMPPWLATAYPDVLRTDFEGRAHTYGQRHNACPNSPEFRRAATGIAEALAARYAGRDGLVAWHIGNEYGGACYCQRCAIRFRDWLAQRYGDLDHLNQAWCTTFWSHRFSDWDQIVPPNALSEHWRDEDHTAFAGITLDYRRFMTDAMLACFTAEKEAIRRHDASTPVTTNFMGLYRPLDYHRWATQLDFASWDNYPPDMHSADRMALAHDLMRGLRDGAPFWLMEQTPSRTAARDVNPVKAPGVMRAWSWQAVAHGADAVCFFQMRASRGACEKDHGALIGHCGRTDTRVFAEAAALGAEFERVGGQLLDARTPARVALLFDWDSWWALEMADGPNRLLRYLDVQTAWYRALWRRGVPMDVVATTADLSGYDVVLAPVLHMVKGDIVARLTAVVARGGTVITGFASGHLDVFANAFAADDPGPLTALTGVRVTETDARDPGEAIGVRLVDAPELETELGAGRYLFDLVAPTGVDTAVVAVYADDWFAGMPAVTRRRVPGGGECWYVGTHLDDVGLATLLAGAVARLGIISPATDGPAGVEQTARLTPDGRLIRFVINHNDAALAVPGPDDGRDLLTGACVARGQALLMQAHGVAVIDTSQTC